MPALQVVGAQGTAINTTIVALTALATDTLAVQNFNEPKKAWLLQIWCDVQLAGTLRVRSTRFHDNVQGIRIDTVASDAQPLMPWGCPQRLYPNDTLVVEASGSSTGGDIDTVALLNYYEDSPGINARFIDFAQLKARAEYTLTAENTLATGTAGGYSGAEAINIEIDNIKAGTDYALVGYKIDTEMAIVGWRASEFGNVRLGGPGDDTNPHLYSNWFVRLSMEYGLPLIPVFAGQNKGGVLLDTACDENGADPTVTSFLVALRPQ